MAPVGDKVHCFSIHPVAEFKHWHSCFESFIAVHNGPSRGTMKFMDGSPVVLQGLDSQGAPTNQGAVQHIMGAADLHAFRALLANPRVAETAVQGKADLKLARAFSLNARSVLGPADTAGAPMEVGDIMSLSVMRVAEFERFRACVTAWADDELSKLPGLKSLTICCSEQLPGTAGEAAVLVVLENVAALQAYMAVWLGRLGTLVALRRASAQMVGARMFNMICVDCEAARRERKAQAQAMWMRPAQPPKECRWASGGGAQEDDEQQQQEQQEQQQEEEDWQQQQQQQEGALQEQLAEEGHVAQQQQQQQQEDAKEEEEEGAYKTLSVQHNTRDEVEQHGSAACRQQAAALAQVQQGLQNLQCRQATEHVADCASQATC